MADYAYRRIYTWWYPNPNPFYAVTHHKGNTKELNPQPQVGGWCNLHGWGASSTYTTTPPEVEANVSQIRYSLVVILELNGVSEVQYKDVMMVDDGKYQ